MQKPKKAFKIITRLVKITPLIFFGIIFVSCNSTDSHRPNFSSAITRIDSVDVPDTILANESYKFDIQYEQPNDCFDFKGFDSRRGEEDNEFIIRAVGIVYASDSCKKYETPKIKTGQLKFNSQNEDSYVLKFLKDSDSLNKPIYITKELIVADEN